MGTVTIPPVAPADFHYGSEIMEKVFSAQGSQQFKDAQAAISDYCNSRFADCGSADEREQKSRELSDALTTRLLYWAKFARRNFGLLQNRGLIVGNKQSNALTIAAAYVPLNIDKDGFDPEEFLAEVDRRLGREHIPVDAAETELLPKELQEFLQGFAMLRTLATHIDWKTKAGEYYEEEVIKEVNQWIDLNPVFTKLDLGVLKEMLRKLKIPKKVWRSIVQDMRGKTLSDLCQMLSLF